MNKVGKMHKFWGNAKRFNVNTVITVEMEEKMKDKLMNGMLSAAGAMQTQRHLAAIKNAFMSLLPIIIIGSFCTLFSNVICNTTPGFFSLANIPGLSFLGKLNPMFTAANYGTMNFIAIGCVILIAMELGEHYGITDKALPVVALGAYISLCAFTASGKAADGTEVVVTNVLSRVYTQCTGAVCRNVCIHSCYGNLLPAGKERKTGNSYAGRCSVKRSKILYDPVSLP